MKKIIGRRERITLPDWKLKMIPAKVDTGAYTSSIHCTFVEEREIDGEMVLLYRVLGPADRKYKDIIHQTTDYTQKKVKNSFGQAEVRYKVKTKVIMFDEEFEAEFTLTDRSKMRNAILLGRKMIQGKFLVDVSEVNLSQKSKT
ncbi:ATP-dependent zinc protease family protein [Belliella aquatica]|uniref:Ribosomal protein S6 modification protein n=1 Tax=Belliella aquatica TaxID=1323734 RepID=A0ABQ1MUA7_9BACT|nr:RimK/LysX family protein [Belliella aquatica]MCH7406584.1 RimK/LysX family protein [Belliella aquatica]GGC47107.1 ribosomal protein S6 modification protein [Belliella aquatica]